jgi:hypothetical protein
MADWVKRMDRYTADGGRYRSSVRSGPRVQYVGLLADRGQVRVRVRAKVRRWLEMPDGKRRALPESRGRQKLVLDEYWTLTRSGGEWIVWSTSWGVKYRKEFTTEPIVPEHLTATVT